MATINSVGTGLLGESGTGSFVGSTGATLTQPKIAQINDSSNNPILTLTPVASASNYLNVVNNVSGDNPSLSVASSVDSNVNLNLTPLGIGFLNVVTSANGTPSLNVVSGTGFTHQTRFVFPTSNTNNTITVPDADGTLLMTGQAINTVPSIAFSPTTGGIVGTTTNNSAASGYVGELLTSIVPSISAISLTSNTTINVTSITLTPGDWDLFGNVAFNGTNMLSVIGCMNNVSATLADSVYSSGINMGTNSGATSFGASCPSLAVSVNTNTIYYLIAVAAFPSGTATVCGGIYARRRR